MTLQYVHIRRVQTTVIFLILDQPLRYIWYHQKIVKNKPFKNLNETTESRIFSNQLIICIF